MAQGDASVYPILPISCSIVVFCYLISWIISIAADYLYDLYLVRYSEEKQKVLIQDRVKSDFTVLKNFFKGNKIEKFDDEEAKKRLTIVQRLLNEKIYSKENKPFQHDIEELKAQKKKLREEKINGKVVELNEKSSSKQLIDKVKKSEESSLKNSKPEHKAIEKSSSKASEEAKTLPSHQSEKGEPKVESKVVTKADPKTALISEPKPVAPLVKTEPKHVEKVEPKQVVPIVKIEPKVVEKAEPKPVAPVVKTEPKHVEKTEPKPVAPIVKIEPKVVEKAEPKPVVPVVKIEPKPVAPTVKIESKIVEKTEPKPVIKNEPKVIEKEEQKPTTKSIEQIETMSIVPTVENNNSENFKQSEKTESRSIDQNEFKQESQDFDEKLFETPKIPEIEKKNGVNQNAPPNLKNVKTNEKSPLSRTPQKIQFVSKPKYANPTPTKTEAPKNITSTNKTSVESMPEDVQPKQVTVDEALDKLKLASRSATVYIEIRDNGVRESSARLGFEDKSYSFPKSENGDYSEESFKNSKLSPTNQSPGNGAKNIKSIKKNNPNPFVAQNSELLETIGKKNPLNKSLAQEYREKSSLSIEEKLKLNQRNNFNPKELIANKNKKTDNKTKKFKYDDDDDEE
jgi:hypothetical protein